MNLLNNREQEKLDKFLDELPKKYKSKSIKLIFSNKSGIGQSIVVKVGKKKKNITDYTSW